MTATADSTQRPSLDLFGDRAVAAYEEGLARELVLRRNRQVGQLLLAERAVLYVQILYRLLLFRRAHELEPLYEDLYEAVRPAQECGLGAGAYEAEQFRADLAQLEDWRLVSSRIEVERLRGYRDSRRRKFRYRLAPDALSFLEWLEERAQSDVYRPEEDARDLLEETSGSLNELRRLLAAFAARQAQEGDARRIVYQLSKLDALSLDANDYLGGFNARLLGFATHEYRIEEAREVLRGLEQFVDGFLRQVHQLRGPIGAQVSALLQSAARQAIDEAAGELAVERRRLPGLLRRGNDPRDPRSMPLALWEFFRGTDWTSSAGVSAHRPSSSGANCTRTCANSNAAARAWRTCARVVRSWPASPRMRRRTASCASCWPRRSCCRTRTTGTTANAPTRRPRGGGPT